MKYSSKDNQLSVATLTSQYSVKMQSPRIVTMELILTEACNLTCSYCFEYNADQKRMMSLATALSAVDFLIDASRNSEWVSITFMGGEPMICYDLIEIIVKYAQKKAKEADKQVYFNMTTNGLLLTEEHLRFFQQEGVRYCLSLDGCRQDNDLHRKYPSGKSVYESLAQKMTLFKKYQPWQGARMTIMPDTAVNLRRNIAVIHEKLAINQFIIGFATGVEWTDRQIGDYNQGLKDAFEYYLEQKVAKHSRRLRISLLEVGELNEAYLKQKESRWGCGAGNGRLAVAPDGRFHGCSKLAWGPDGSKTAAAPLGNVETDLDRWDNRLKLLDQTITPRRKCRSCELAISCNGGCYAVNYAETGDIYLPSDTYCKLVYAQKNACDYGRKRMKELGLNYHCWKNKTSSLK